MCLFQQYKIILPEATFKYEHCLSFQATQHTVLRRHSKSLGHLGRQENLPSQLEHSCAMKESMHT